ncbi:hypothetical protein BDW22DRAFT_318139 [Trametopsis cervina]|nr:hypothetical protein BDW22DRAFT_318139 [Trametopsis cervina]
MQATGNSEHSASGVYGRKLRAASICRRGPDATLARSRYRPMSPRRVVVLPPFLSCIVATTLALPAASEVIHCPQPEQHTSSQQRSTTLPGPRSFVRARSPSYRPARHSLSLIPPTPCLTPNTDAHPRPLTQRNHLKNLCVWMWAAVSARLRTEPCCGVFGMCFVAPLQIRSPIPSYSQRVHVDPQNARSMY